MKLFMRKKGCPMTPAEARRLNDSNRNKCDEKTTSRSIRLEQGTDADETEFFEDGEISVEDDTNLEPNIEAVVQDGIIHLAFYAPLLGATPQTNSEETDDEGEIDLRATMYNLSLIIDGAIVQTMTLGALVMHLSTCGISNARPCTGKQGDDLNFATPKDEEVYYYFQGKPLLNDDSQHVAMGKSDHSLDEINTHRGDYFSTVNSSLNDTPRKDQRNRYERNVSVKADPSADRELVHQSIRENAGEGVGVLNFATPENEDIYYYTKGKALLDDDSEQSSIHPVAMEKKDRSFDAIKTHLGDSFLNANSTLVEVMEHSSETVQKNQRNRDNELQTFFNHPMAGEKNNGSFDEIGMQMGDSFSTANSTIVEVIEHSSLNDTVLEDQRDRHDKNIRANANLAMESELAHQNTGKIAQKVRKDQSIWREADRKKSAQDWQVYKDKIEALAAEQRNDENVLEQIMGISSPREDSDSSLREGSVQDSIERKKAKIAKIKKEQDEAEAEAEQAETRLNAAKKKVSCIVGELKRLNGVGPAKRSRVIQALLTIDESAEVSLGWGDAKANLSSVQHKNTL
mmetsp:Transcript_8614/g.18523  ORF Transcript_8614/g.18523 Transcript_8614/m.18523 type:complete len:571 (-) Transcript_8614:36-1748(-)